MLYFQTSMPAPDEKLNKYKKQQQIVKKMKTLLTKEHITKDMVEKMFSS